MFDPKLYRKACDRMILDAEKIEEMISMTENQDKRTTARRPLRAAMLAAAVVAALGITASAAELPAVKEFFATIFVTVTSDDTGLTIPSVAVEEREGRSILLVNDEETDITDALAQEGGYLYEGDGFRVEVDEKGVAVVTSYGDNGMTVSYSTEDPEVQGGMVYKVTTDNEGLSEYDLSVDVVGAAAPAEVEGISSYQVTTDDNGVISVKSVAAE
ncbi:MAG: hypothetical protein HFF06_06710 [Oscillospiraceae bacterium]|nr:hypothetical protein [Oscillospiraceae bacterium]